MRHIRPLPAVIAIPLFTGCLYVAMIGAALNPKPLPTVPGPEFDLASTVSGTVLLEASGEITGFRLPSLERFQVSTAFMDGDKVWSFAGPDRRGRVAVISFGYPASRHSLWSVDLDDPRARRLFQRTGDPMWESAIAFQMALAPDSGEVAIVTPLRNQQLPEYMLERGPIEIWDMVSGEHRELGVEAILNNMPWSPVLAFLPDNRHLAYVAPVDRSEVVSAEDEWNRGTESFRMVPAVCILDTETMDRRLVCTGETLVVSPDGKSILVESVQSESQPMRWQVVDLETGATRPFTFPGGSGSPIALVSPDILLCATLPTEGTPVRFNYAHSPLRGPQPYYALKLIDLRDGRFQTIEPHVDYWDVVSLGMPSE